MSLDLLSFGVACQCGKWFKRVHSLVEHIKACQEFKDAAAADANLVAVYEALLHLKGGTLA